MKKYITAAIFLLYSNLAMAGTPTPVFPLGLFLQKQNIGSTPFQAGNGGITASTLAQRFGNNKNLIDDFGAACDGTASDDTAMTNMGAAGVFIIPPISSPLTNYCKTTFAWNANPAKVLNFFGSGRVVNSTGDFNGPIYVQTSSRPALLPGYVDSFLKRWNADWSNVPIAMQVITNAGAFGPGPGTGYEFEKQQAGIYMNCISYAGRNSAPDKGQNRSGYGCHWIDITNNSTGPDGGGDTEAIYITGGVSGTHDNATSFLGAPEIGGLGGQFNVLVDRGWIEPLGDLNVVDHGFQGASTSVINIIRTNAVGDWNTMHMGWLVHSVGTVPIDTGFKIAGPAMTGLDAATMQTTSHALAIQPPIISGGTGYVVGQVLQPVMDGQWVCDQIPTFRVGQVDGNGAIYDLDFTHPGLVLDRRGMCKTFPASNVTIQLTYGASNTITPANGTGATANFTFSNSTVIALPISGGISFASYCQQGVFSTCFASTEYLGNYWMGYDGDLGAVNLISYTLAGPVSLMQAGGNSLTMPAGAKFFINGGRHSTIRDVMTGSNTNMDANGGNTDNTVVIRTDTAAQFTFSLIDCTEFSNGRTVTVKEILTSAATSLRINAAGSSTVEGQVNFTMPSKTGATYQCDYSGGLKDWVKIN